MMIHPIRRNSRRCRYACDCLTTAGQISIRIAVSLLAFAIAACADAPLATGPGRIDTVHSSGSSRSTGTLSGWVSLSDYLDSTYYPANRSRVLVAIDGTGLSTTTDSSGHWVIRDIPPGTYSISISREGFGTYRAFGKRIVGGGETYLPAPVSLGRIPTGDTAANLQLHPSYGGAGVVVLTGNFWPRPLPSRIAIWLLVGRNATVSSNPGTCFYSTTGEYNPGNGVFLASLITSQLPAYYKPGDHVFCTVCFGQWSDSLRTYWDPTVDARVDPGLSPLHSNVLEVVLR